MQSDLIIHYEPIIKEAAFKLDCNPLELRMVSWYHQFGSTAGPHVGRIGGAAMTDFQVLGFSNYTRYNSVHVMYCAGVWKEWDGKSCNW